MFDNQERHPNRNRRQKFPVEHQTLEARLNNLGELVSKAENEIDTVDCKTMSRGRLQNLGKIAEDHCLVEFTVGPLMRSLLRSSIVLSTVALRDCQRRKITLCKMSLNGLLDDSARFYSCLEII